MCFNTTFVTVLSSQECVILCTSLVSIQLLLLFYIKNTIKSLFTDLVSIQTFVTVLYYKRVKAEIMTMFQYNFCYCSICKISLCGGCILQFQYNFCYCSIDFYVSQSSTIEEFQYNFCYCSMNVVLTTFSTSVRFQYNFCYCSIHRHC